jgi:ornithine cyclodeaminase/alanine dehydrogenase
MEEFIHLSRADIAACALDAATVNDAVEAAFRVRAQGEATMRPALTLPATGRASFRAKAAVLPGLGYAAVKWYGYYPENAALGETEYTPLILLNETGRGRPVALLDGQWITAMRTAAVSAVGASALAVQGAERVAFIGCGVQARTHLLALLARFPLRQATLLGRRAETVAEFAAFVTDHGVTPEITAEPRAALANAQLVITTVPRLSPRTHFLDASWTAPGSFTSMVDAGVAWAPASLGGFDRVFTDDREQATHLEAGDADMASEADLCEVVGGGAGRLSARERIALVFKGVGLADAAVAVAVYERAQALGLGRRLAL